MLPRNDITYIGYVVRTGQKATNLMATYKRQRNGLLSIQWTTVSQLPKVILLHTYLYNNAGDYEAKMCTAGI